MADEVTGISGVGQKSDHVGLGRRCCECFTSTPSAFPIGCTQTLRLPTAPAALCLRAFAGHRYTPLCMDQAGELMLLGVAPNLCGVLNKYPGVLPLRFDTCEAHALGRFSEIPRRAELQLPPVIIHLLTHLVLASFVFPVSLPCLSPTPVLPEIISQVN